MRNFMETQLSWLAVFMTAFYSLLASCRGEDCGTDKLEKCSAPLARLAQNVTTEESLMQLCPSLQQAIKCTSTYTKKCMNEDHRKLFTELYKGTNTAIRELCQEGKHQQDFLIYNRCMQRHTKEYEVCSSEYEKEMSQIAEKNGQSVAGPEVIQNVCCSFQKYLHCSKTVVKNRCGDNAAQFTSKFLDMISSSLITTHCANYNQCDDFSIRSGVPRSSSPSLRVGFLTPVLLVTIARFFA